MAYTYRLFDSIDDVDLAAWERVCSECGASIFMDLRFIGAVEASITQNCRFWYVMIYENDCPVACACLSALAINLADFAEPGLAWILRHLPPGLSRLRHWKLMFCGFPVSTGHPALALTTGHASERILPVLDCVICRLASETRMDAIVYKEFPQHDLEWTSPLLDLGYERIATPPVYFFRPLFPDLEHYCAALRSHYRKQIKRSIAKLRQTGVKTTVLTNSEQIAKVYTPEVHDLYHQMRDRANTKFDLVSIEFFRELAFRLGDHIDLVVLSGGSRILAFGWCIWSHSSYHMLYAGVDYKANADMDLYFNLHYAALDCALRRGVSRIELGITADAFKARLGCCSQPLYAFMKGVGPLMSRIVRHCAGLLFAQKRAAIPSFDIFKSDVTIEGLK
jgi:predicted N-acyltransferase